MNFLGLYYRMITSRLFLLAGIDTAMIYTFMARAIGALCSPITLWFILTFLTPEEMGFYYTFISLLGIGMLFDLGFSNVLMLFASHEVSKLSWQDKNRLTGDSHTMRRMAGIMHLGLKWFVSGSILFAFIMIPTGLYFLGSREDAKDINYRLPWIFSVLVAMTAGFVHPVRNIFEGCGKVKEMRLLGFLQPLVSYPIQWALFILGFGMFAYGGFYLGGVLIMFSWFLIKQRPFLASTVFAKGEEVHFKLSEMWPFLWRTILGSIGGYLVFCLFNPIAFKQLGPIDAGKLGASFGLCSYINVVAMPFLNNKIPTLGELWARKHFTDLNKLFKACIIRVLTISILASITIALLAYVLKEYSPKYGTRFLDMHQLGLIFITAVLTNMISSISLFVRSNKQDPLVWTALTYGILMAASNWTMINKFGLTGMLVGYLAVSMAMLCVYIAIARINIQKWQSGRDNQTNAK